MPMVWDIKAPETSPLDGARTSGAKKLATAAGQQGKRGTGFEPDSQPACKQGRIRFATEWRRTSTRSLAAYHNWSNQNGVPLPCIRTKLSETASELESGQF